VRGLLLLELDFGRVATIEMYDTTPDRRMIAKWENITPLFLMSESELLNAWHRQSCHIRERKGGLRFNGPMPSESIEILLLNDLSDFRTFGSSWFWL
jgi:hypothetical protein